MKVLFGYLTYAYRGGSKFQLDFAGNFQNAEIGFITSNQKVEYEDMAKAIGKIHRIPPTKKLFERMRVMKELAKEYDILYLNKAVLNPAELWIAKNAGFKKVVFHSHAMAKDCSNSVIRGLYHLLHYVSRPFVSFVADAEFACSESAAEWLFGKKKGKDAVVIKNGIDLGSFSFSPEMREEKRNELGIHGFCILHVGSFTSVKNQGYLLEAFRFFHKAHPDCVLYFVGDGELLDSVKRKVEAWGLSDVVSFLGQRKDVCSLLQAADLFVLPSLSEGFSFVALEAQAAGLPCLISSAVPSNIKINDNVDFFNISASAAELAEHMEKKMGDSRIQSAESLAEAGYDLRSCAVRLEQDLEKLLNENGS